MDPRGVGDRACALARIASTGLALAALALGAPQAGASGWRHGGVCTKTAGLQYAACWNEVWDDYLTAKAGCINVADAEERGECLAEAWQESWEAGALCREQREARREVCDLLGEDRYDPDFDPADFDDDLAALTSPNPFLPLAVGNRWEYAGDGESIEIEVQDATKRIEDVTCFVVRDVAFEDGVAVEDTDDWVAQAKDGDSHYCGEISQNFELFEGDDPEVPELVDVDGSWKTGRDGAQPGILVPASPTAGFAYRQEYLVGDAEDVAQVLTTTYGHGDDPDLDELVPEDLAELLCDGDCMVTRDFTPIEPGVFELKYYAPGIGLFLEVNLEEEEIVQLVDCNMDARCAMLPAPQPLSSVAGHEPTGPGGDSRTGPGSRRSRAGPTLASMAKPAQPPPWRCPACGDTLECGSRSGADTCWCADLPPVAPDPGLPPGECLCERCLRQRIAAEAR